jgi:hypothetical protein
MKRPGGTRALLGTAVHASTAVYDGHREEISMDDAADALIETLHHPEFEVNYNTDDLTIPKAEAIGLKLHSLYCREVSPQYEFAAVERETTPMDIDCGDGIIIQLTGTLDRSRSVVGKEGHTRIADLKTGVRAVQKGEAKTQGHKAQVGTYELLEEHTTGNTVESPAEIIGLSTSGTPKYAVGQIENAKQVLIGTDEAPGLIDLAKQMFKTGLYYPNPQTWLCSVRYCSRWETCPYHE